MLSSFAVFFTYVFNLIQNFVRVTNPYDLGLSLGLYVVYPAILWLLLEKFHGLCGRETYLQKTDAILACQSLFFWFTFLLRTYKFGVLVLYSVDAGDKQGSQRELDSGGEVTRSTVPTTPTSEGVAEGSGVLKQLKCQTWMHLLHELAAVGFVAFLVLVCLPVLAFWFMFLSILVSGYNLIQLVKRLWNDSQDSVISSGDSEGGGEDNNDVEFQEFLSNFAPDDNQEEETSS